MLSLIWLFVWVMSLSVEFDLALHLGYEFKCWIRFGSSRVMSLSVKFDLALHLGYEFKC